MYRRSLAFLHGLCGLAALATAYCLVIQGFGFATLLAGAGLCCIACSAIAYRMEFINT